MQASQVESSRLDMLKGTVGDVRSGKNDDRRAKLDTLSTKGIAWLHLVERRPEKESEREETIAYTVQTITRKGVSKNIPRWGLFSVLCIHDAHFYAFTFTSRKATSSYRSSGRKKRARGRRKVTAK